MSGLFYNEFEMVPEKLRRQYISGASQMFLKALPPDRPWES